MIFKTVSDLNSNTERSFFREKILLYNRIIEVYSEKYNIPISIYKSLNSKFYDELINIGVIQKEADLPILKRILGIKIYNSFIQKVLFAIENKEGLYPHIYKLYNSERKKIQMVEAQKKRPTMVDFFCGAGGLSLGFIQNGFLIKLANDFENVCIETYKYNHPEVPSSRVLEKDIRDLISSIDNYNLSNIDLVVGGPPCQGFSSANQQRVIDDPRNELYKYFIKAVTAIAPKFVVMENVRGMLPYADQVVEDFENVVINKNGKTFKYKAGYRLLNSEDFSVAQKRLRLIYIAIREDVMGQYNICPISLFDQIDQANRSKDKYVLKDALKYIKDLEANRIPNTTEVDSDISGKKVDVNTFMGNENEYLKLINQGSSIPIIYNHKSRYVSDLNYEIYRRLNEGDDATDEKIAEIMPYSHRNHVFKDKYYKLVANAPSRTITAHLRMDCHSHIHPYQIRNITPREAARIQSFPDDYVFLGAYLKTYMQIGNAVPPLMARGIGKVIINYI